MSSTVISYVIHGIKLPRKAYEVCMRGCNHYINEGDKFCSECGKPAFTVSNIDMEEIVEDWQQHRSYGYFEHSNSFKVVYTNAYSEDCVVGIVLAKINSRGYKDEIQEVGEIQENMLEHLYAFLEKYNFKFNNGDIKTYTVLYQA